MVQRLGCKSIEGGVIAAFSPAFDREAAAYRTRWDRSPIVPFWRARILTALTAGQPAGARVLDLGCGTGVDAALLTAAGHRVVGIDGSPGMVALARAGGVDARLGDVLDAQRLVGSAFDLALLNFGVVNCLESLDPLVRTLEAVVRPRGRVALVAMSPRCPAESARRALRLQRPRRGRRQAEVSGTTVPCFWWTLGQIRQALRPGFRVTHVEALGLLTAGPDLGARPGAGETMQTRLGSLPVLREWGDHTLIVADRA